MDINTNSWAGQITAPVAIAVGILICFWGYRILKLTLGIIGFIAGAGGGWELGLALVSGNTGVALVCAAIVGLLSAALSIWLFWLGIFLLGAGAGAVVAAGVFGGTGHQAQPILIVALAILFGLLAVLVKRLMIVVSTAFGGAYLIAAGLFHFTTHGPGSSPLWFGPLPRNSAGPQDLVALALWLALGVAGMLFQFRARRRKDERAREENQAA